MDRLDYLINYLLKENKEIKIDKIPKNKEDKKKLYRSLCNIREPKPVDKQYIQIENEYLQEELQNKKITKYDGKNICDSAYEDLEILEIEEWFENNLDFLWNILFKIENITKQEK